MAISFFDKATANAAISSAVTLPAGILAGDIIILFGWGNTTTIPSLTSGYTAISAQGANSNSMRSEYKIAAGTEGGTSVTFTNAQEVIAAVYRGASGIGGAGSGTNVAGTTDSIPGVGTFTNTSGTSWVVSFSGSLQRTSMSTPAGSTLRASDPGTASSGGMAILVDSNAGVSSWGAHSSTLGTSAVSSGGSVELVAAVSGGTAHNLTLLGVGA